MKTNRDESKAEVLALETKDHRVWFKRGYVRAKDERSGQTMEELARLYLRGEGPWPGSVRIENKHAAIEKCHEEISQRAKGNIYGWPIVPALKVQHPEPYTPGQRDYAKLLEAAKRKPVGYVTTKAEVENTTDTLPPPVVAYMGDKPALWSSALDASNATAKAPTAKPDAEWPKVLMPKDGAGSLYVPCAYNSGHESMTYLSSGEINKSVLNSYSDTLACGNHRPGTMAELVAWLRANGHAAEADRLEGADKKQTLEIGDRITVKQQPCFQFKVDEAQVYVVVGDDKYVAGTYLLSKEGRDVYWPDAHEWSQFKPEWAVVIRRQPANGARAWKNLACYGVRFADGRDYIKMPAGYWRKAEWTKTQTCIEDWMKSTEGGHEILDPAKVAALIEELKQSGVMK